MSTALLFSQILNGLATGMLYALMGIGLSMITGVLNIPNFAHGALFALGAYFLYSVIQLVGNFSKGVALSQVCPRGVFPVRKTANVTTKRVGWSDQFMGI